MDTKRFNRPDYKKQIHANRTYRRHAAPRPEGHRAKFLQRLNSHKFVILLIIILIGGFVYLSYFAKFFQITNFAIENAGSAQQVQIRGIFADYTKTYRNILPQKNIFFFSSARFSAELLSKDSGLSAVSAIKKDYFNKVTISVTERVAAFALQAQNGFYILISDGALSSPIQQSDAAKLPLIILADSESVNSGEQFLSQTRYNFISTLSQDFPKAAALAIDHFELPAKNTDQVILAAKKGFKIYFDASTDPNQNVQNFLTIWNSLTPDQQSKLLYADLRFKQNAYLCYHGDKCSQ